MDRCYLRPKIVILSPLGYFTNVINSIGLTDYSALHMYMYYMVYICDIFTDVNLELAKTLFLGNFAILRTTTQLY